MNKIWKTRKGEKIKIKDMTDDHILNAMAMILGKCLLREHRKYIKYIKQLILPDVYFDLKEEIEKRGGIKDIYNDKEVIKALCEVVSASKKSAKVLAKEMMGE